MTRTNPPVRRCVKFLGEHAWAIPVVLLTTFVLCSLVTALTGDERRQAASTGLRLRKLLVKAEAQLDAGDLPAAAESCRSALALNKDLVPALVLLGGIHLRLGEELAALRRFDAALGVTRAVQDEVLEQCFERAQELIGAGEADRAVDLAVRASALVPPSFAGDVIIRHVEVADACYDVAAR